MLEFQEAEAVVLVYLLPVLQEAVIPNLQRVEAAKLAVAGKNHQALLQEAAGQVLGEVEKTRQARAVEVLVQAAVRQVVINQDHHRRHTVLRLAQVQAPDRGQVLVLQVPVLVRDPAQAAPARVEVVAVEEDKC